MAKEIELYDMNIESDGKEAVSSLGTPIVGDLKLVYEGDEYYFDTILLTVTQQKNIQLTKVIGRKGTVKEYVSDGDYTIALKAVIVGDNKFPKVELRRLRRFLSIPDALEVVSEYLRIFDIYSIVVTGFEFSQESIEDTQVVKINAISDEPIELTIHEEINL